MLHQYYDELISIAESIGVKTLNDFEYFDEDMIEEFGIELEEVQPEWHSAQDGIIAISAVLSDERLPQDPDLREELEQLIGILKNVPEGSLGWRLQQDI